MRALSINERGILLTVAATASFSTNDTLLKLATESMPPFETIFIRSIFAILWGLPLLGMTRGFGQIGRIADKRVLIRNFIELIAVLGFIVGLSHMPIAEFSALNQLAPILLLLGAGIFLKIRITGMQFAFAGVALLGALLVAQPGSVSFTPYAFLGVWNAACSAARELVGRTVPAGISGVVVAVGAVVVSLFGAGAATFAFETFQVPTLTETGLIAAAALFLMGGHIFIFMAYRSADPGAVAPFVYTSMLWAVIAQVVVFGSLPNTLALAGMVLIVASGIGVLVLTERQSRAEARAAINAVSQ